MAVEEYNAHTAQRRVPVVAVRAWRRSRQSARFRAQACREWRGLVAAWAPPESDLPRSSDAGTRPKSRVARLL